MTLNFLFGENGEFFGDFQKFLTEKCGIGKALQKNHNSSPSSPRLVKNRLDRRYSEWKNA